MSLFQTVCLSFSNQISTAEDEEKAEEETEKNRKKKKKQAMRASPFHDSIPLIKQCKHCR